VDVQDGPGGTVVRLTGELDAATAPTLASCFATLGERHPSQLVVDVTALAFCDCAGLNILLATHREAVASGGWLRLCGATAHLQKIIRITRLSSVLRCYPDVEEAVADLTTDSYASSSSPSASMVTSMVTSSLRSSTLA
jgi:anti-anti-sigma factor